MLRNRKKRCLSPLRFLAKGDTRVHPNVDVAMQLLLALLLPAVALGAVEQVTDQATFKRILAESPAVVVDFFSQSCGPCIMIAPKYKELAKEYEGRVRFLKVDVQQHNVGVQVRSMPTFHFYFQGKLDHQFSGADENGMRQQTAQLDRKAEAADVEVSLGALEAFYKEHDPSKLDNVDEIYEKYPAYKLVAILKKKYGKAPEFTKKNSRKAPKAEGGAKAEAGGDKPVDIRKMDMDDLKAEVLRRPHTRTRAPRAGVCACPLQDLELPAKRRIRARILVPRAAVLDTFNSSSCPLLAAA